MLHICNVISSGVDPQSDVIQHSGLPSEQAVQTDAYVLE